MDNKYIGITTPEALIPSETVNLKKWAVIACDQYTSNMRYWQDVERFVGNNPSMLHIILPEVYLQEEDLSARIAHAKETMRDYIDDGILKALPPGFILVERIVNGNTRKGLLVCIDLEEYDFDLSDNPSIRPTEETILDRIPPRIEIRQGADVESPHVMILMDDKNKQVIEPLYVMREYFPMLYDFDLMADGGKVRGYFIDNHETEEKIFKALEELELHDGMRFCVGDGNHSLATAKTIWEQAKKTLNEEELAESPLRYAMVELLDLNDEGLPIKPIHRVLTNVKPAQCLQYIVEKLNAQGKDARLVFSRRKLSAGNISAPHNIFFISRESTGRIEIRNPKHPMVVGEIQPVLEQYVEEHESSMIDYVHGEEELERLAQEYDTLGFYMPTMKKEKFFDLVTWCGVLPKKSFSLGDANEKRYYLECRLLKLMEKEGDEPQQEEQPQGELVLEEQLEEEIIYEEDDDEEEKDPVIWRELEELPASEDEKE